ncbi:hypothetical protein [Pedobacter yonginense]|uniref:hypothetical protein n=1 Tax=Pedobacter yonginense TaxID=651869 RepID=UPI0014022047|nr:hypothetical protein [Pedobacter yonginense]
MQAIPVIRVTAVIPEMMVLIMAATQDKTLHLKLTNLFIPAGVFNLRRDFFVF